MIFQISSMATMINLNTSLYPTFLTLNFVSYLYVMVLLDNILYVSLGTL